MFVTEEEASGRWCPHGREIRREYQGSGVSALTSFNRSPNGDVPSCLGSLCMAWRWKDPKVLREIDLTTSDIVDAPPRRGYCGAFGKPEEE